MRMLSHRNSKISEKDNFTRDNNQYLILLKKYNEMSSLKYLQLDVINAKMTWTGVPIYNLP